MPETKLTTTAEHLLARQTINEALVLVDACPECGGSTYEWEHQPCSDHPELTITVHECENNECTWSEEI